MLPSRQLFSSSTTTCRGIMVDEARPNRHNQKGIFQRRVGVDRKHRLFIPPKAQQHQRYLYSSNKMRSSVNSTKSSMEFSTLPENVLIWMQNSCPMDVLPMIIAYAGPQKAQVLNQTNTYWHSIFSNETIWKQLCEELYKWKPGDEQPLSWKTFYQRSPCVPVDYPTIMDALAIASDHDEITTHDASNLNPRVMEQRRSIRILLRPGDYYMKEAIVVQAVGQNTSLSIETMDIPSRNTPSLVTEETSSSSTTDELEALPAPAAQSNKFPAQGFIKRARSFRKKLSCRSMDAVQDSNSSESEDEEQSSKTPVRATLISKFRAHNEPALWVRQGTLQLKNIAVNHNCNGIDIWNGNAAIQIQPSSGPDENPLPTRPKAYLQQVDVTSRSGRGIVNIDGGTCSISRCYVHDCAATGIYVGGPGSRATIEETDVIRNGGGNNQRRGIAPGHSGIYLEQGCAVVRNCNISQNSLTGISAVSQQNAILDMEATDLIANGAMQLEMPPTGSESHTRSSTQNNNMAETGSLRNRSGMVVE